MGAAVAAASVLNSERCVAAEPFAAAIGAPLALPKRGVVFEGLQEFLAAALRRAAAVSADGHEHDRLAGEHPADAVLHQAAVHPVAVAAVEGEPLQLLLRHAGVVLEFQRLQGGAISGCGAHSADEHALGSVIAVPLDVELALPLLQLMQWLKALAVEVDPELHCSSFSHR